MDNIIPDTISVHNNGNRHIVFIDHITGIGPDEDGNTSIWCTDSLALETDESLEEIEQLIYLAKR